MYICNGAHSFVLLHNCLCEEFCHIPCRTYSLIVTTRAVLPFATDKGVESEADLSKEPEVDEGEVAALEELLGSKLAEFLSADYSCSLCQLASSVRPHLYKGPSSSSKVSSKLTTSLTLL